MNAEGRRISESKPCEGKSHARFDEGKVEKKLISLPTYSTLIV